MQDFKNVTIDKMSTYTMTDMIGMVLKLNYEEKNWPLMGALHDYEHIFVTDKHKTLSILKRVELSCNLI